jgi:hypothetical protein
VDFVLGGRLTFAKSPRRLATTFDLHSSVIRTLVKVEEEESVVNFLFSVSGLAFCLLPQHLLYTESLFNAKTKKEEV